MSPEIYFPFFVSIYTPQPPFAAKYGHYFWSVVSYTIPLGFKKKNGGGIPLPFFLPSRQNVNVRAVAGANILVRTNEWQGWQVGNHLNAMVASESTTRPFPRRWIRKSHRAIQVLRVPWLNCTELILNGQPEKKGKKTEQVNTFQINCKRAATRLESLVSCFTSFSLCQEPSNPCWLTQSQTSKEPA